MPDAGPGLPRPRTGRPRGPLADKKPHRTAGLKIILHRGCIP
nr:MAG TPA: hypothetical protein [Caudoviricetes sp.]